MFAPPCSDLPEAVVDAALDVDGERAASPPASTAACAAASMSSTSRSGRITGSSDSCIGARTPSIPPPGSGAVRAFPSPRRPPDWSRQPVVVVGASVSSWGGRARAHVHELRSRTRAPQLRAPRSRGRSRHETGYDGVANDEARGSRDDRTAARCPDTRPTAPKHESGHPLAEMAQPPDCDSTNPWLAEPEHEPEAPFVCRLSTRRQSSSRSSLAGRSSPAFALRHASDSAAWRAARSASSRSSPASAMTSSSSVPSGSDVGSSTTK